MIKPFEPKTLKAALKEIERQRAINLKYADLFEKREKELKEENANLSERLYAEQSDVLESDQKLDTIYKLLTNWDSYYKNMEGGCYPDWLVQLRDVFKLDVNNTINHKEEIGGKKE